jgi:CheY-like chemotaxis protein
VILGEQDRRDLVAAFTADARARVVQVEGGLRELERATSSEMRRKAFTTLALEAHNLRGAAATVGLAEIEALATELERTLTGTESTNGSTDQVATAATRLLDALRGLEGPGGGVTAPPAEIDATGSAIVLHIEDNDANRKLVERVLARRPQIRLVEAHDGATGIALATELEPSLILLDLRLPDIAGDEVLRRLRAEPALRDIPVVLISAEARPAESDRLLAGGASAYLVKPIDVQTLLDVVDGLLLRVER